MGFPPEWALILEAAGYDPLRAMEIEERIDQEWWQRWLVDRDARVSAQNKDKKHGR